MPISIENNQITILNPATLNEAMKLGSLTEKNHSFELGKFGMGLVTSSISIGKKLSVITKAANSELVEGIQDLDLIAKENKFIKTLQEWKGDSKNKLLMLMNGNDPKKINNNIDDQTGTIVSISNIDKCEWKRADTLAEKMKKSLQEHSFSFYLLSYQII